MANVGKAQKLTDSSAQALQALINSLSPGETGEKFSEDQVARLSNKLSQLVGNDGLDGLTETRNDNGELVNEEGLPIIEITEPQDDANSTSVHESPLITDRELVSLISLPKAEAERRRRERDRILDLLETEERRDNAMVEWKEREERQAALEKRKNASTFELQKLKAVKEMHKKMGKALLHNMAQAREREENDKMRAFALDKDSEEKKALKPKKSVTFADPPLHVDDERTRHRTLSSPKGAPFDWGDVSAARLRATNRNMLITKGRLDKHPMKMDVVERVPLGVPLVEEPNREQRDSDDESVPESLLPADSDDGQIIWSGHDHDGVPQSEARSSDCDGDEEPEDVEDEYDLDTARHQREIALEYYEKRGTIGKEVFQAMRSHSHEAEDEWDQEEVPLEATLSSPPPKPLISKFKASRVTSSSSYNASASSASLGSTVLPASSSQTLQRAVRIGKLENDQLVGPPQSDTEDEDENLRNMIEMLKEGEVQNIGQHDIPSLSRTSSSSGPSSLHSLDGRALPSATKYKASMFRQTRPQRQPSPSSSTILESRPITPVSHNRRSSPKLPSSPDAVEYWPPCNNSILAQKSRESNPSSKFMPDTVPSVSSQAPQIIDSPSFQRPAHITPRSPTSPSPTLASSFQPEPARRLTRPLRPPTVMSSTVREFTPTGTGAGVKNLSDAGGDKKISRFLAERM